MAIALTTAGNDRVEFGDLAGIAGLTDITVALTLRLSAAPNSRFLCGQWGGDATKQAFLVQVIDTDEIGFVVQGGVGPNYYAGKTTAVNLASGSTYRIVARIYGLAGSQGFDFFVNGSSVSSTTWFTIGTLASIRDAAITCYVGYEVDEGFACEEGDYSEFAIWGAKLPDADCAAYGNGFSPDLLSRTGRILYAPMIRGTNDKWGGSTGTLTGGSVASHPRVIYPRRRQAYSVAAAAPASAKGHYYRNHLMARRRAS